MKTRRTLLLILLAFAAPFGAAAQFPPLPVQPGAPVDPDVRFEVASIKPYDDSSGMMRMMMQPARFEAMGLPVRLLMRQAFRVQDYQLVGLPDWASAERYTITAKAPGGAPPNAVPVMLANLLKDRFALTMHTERREMPAFDLVLARADGRLGPQFKESSAECQALIKERTTAGPGRGGPPPLPGTPGGPPLFDPAKQPCGSMRTGPGIIGGGGLPLAQLVQMLSQFSGRPVNDRTKLTGFFDFTLNFTPEPGLGTSPFGPPPAGAPPLPADTNAPNLFTAVQEQLGLKLESVRAPIEVVVVDRLDKPTAD
jgi:uncharacterized protein (TIGR03435 family)